MWKDIKGFEGLYQVSNIGNVRTLIHQKTRGIIELKKQINAHGNFFVKLSKNGKVTYKIVARLVYETFVKALKRNDVVRYKDNNFQNCSLDNLYVISSSHVQLILEELGRKSKIQYKYYDKMLTINQISEITGIDYDTIRSRIRKKWNIYETVETPICNNYSHKKKGGKENAIK